MQIADDDNDGVICSKASIHSSFDSDNSLVPISWKVIIYYNDDWLTVYRIGWLIDWMIGWLIDWFTTKSVWLDDCLTDCLV